MAIIRSFGTVQSVAAAMPVSTTPSSAAGSWSGLAYSYATMYRTQPNVRTVVDFLARNVAQVGLHAFRRHSDTDRERLADYPVIQWLTHPNPGTTRYQLFESLMQDRGIYGIALWLKIRGDKKRIGLVRLPPEQVEIEGGLFPSLYRWTSTRGETRDFAPSEIVHFGGCTLSPLETLRRILLEEIAAQDYRAFYWRNHARMDGVIERDKDQKPWNPDQYKAWREQWTSSYTGRENTGKSAVLMPGMKWVDRSFSAKDSELNSARKLAREEVTRAYHVPLPLAGILDHATFSNIKEQHKNLYQDSLGPHFVDIEEVLEIQLLPEADDPENVYFEFNIAEKLKGSFEEQADSILKLVGRPIMTANEGRARLNFSAIDDPTADELAQPLNTTTPSTASAPGSSADAASDAEPDEAAVAAVIAQHRARQAVRLDKVYPGDRPGTFNLTRYNAELTEDLVAIGMPETHARETAARANAETLRALTDALVA